MNEYAASVGGSRRPGCEQGWMERLYEANLNISCDVAMLSVVVFIAWRLNDPTRQRKASGS